MFRFSIVVRRDSQPSSLLPIMCLILLIGLVDSHFLFGLSWGGLSFVSSLFFWLALRSSSVCVETASCSLLVEMSVRQFLLLHGCCVVPADFIACLIHWIVAGLVFQFVLLFLVAFVVAMPELLKLAREVFDAGRFRLLHKGRVICDGACPQQSSASSPLA
jgi:hypothetical protein